MTVTKARECQVYGATNRVQFEDDVMMVERPCASCGAMVRWRRKILDAGGQIDASEENGVGLAPLDSFEIGEL